MSIKYAEHKSSKKSRVDCERMKENLGIIKGDHIHRLTKLSGQKQKKGIRVKKPLDKIRPSSTERI